MNVILRVPRALPEKRDRFSDMKRDKTKI